MPDSKFGKAADQWFVELEQAFEVCDLSPGGRYPFRYQRGPLPCRSGALVALLVLPVMQMIVPRIT